MSSGASRGVGAFCSGRPTGGLLSGVRTHNLGLEHYTDPAIPSIETLLYGFSLLLFIFRPGLQTELYILNGL